MFRSPRYLTFVLFLTVPILQAEPLAIRDTLRATHPLTAVEVVTGKVDLPRQGWWFVERPFAVQGGLVEIYLANESGGEDEFDGEGERMAKIMDRRATRSRENLLRRIYWASQTYAREHGGMAPNSLVELNDAQAAENDRPKPVYQAEGVRFVQGVRLLREGEDAMERVEPFLVDTTPAIDDGKHWIVNSQGISERVEIDPELVKRLGITIKAQQLPAKERGQNQPKTVEHTIHARIKGDAGKVDLTVRDFRSKEALPITWDLSSAGQGDPELCKKWAGLRLDHLYFAARRDAPLGQYWAQRTIAQHGLEEDYSHLLPQEERFTGRTTGAMGVLGGRAAIQETLQMQNLQSLAEDEDYWKPTIPIETIPGVEIEAHPFEEMLAGKPGGSLPLAGWIPHDHFLAYFPEPKGIFSLLEGGSDFVFNSGATVTGRSAAYRLKERYLDTFGISEKLLRRFLETGAIEEMALTVPDLFIADGTEVSAVMSLGRPILASAALALVGVPPRDGLTEKTNSHGEKVYWLRRGSILVVSTSKAEIDAITTAKDEGPNLAASPELRYMLTQVPVTADTKMFFYFSDPFIRNLVGPRTKIGQLRRLLARAEMEETSAGSLLARFDGHTGEALALPALRERNYAVAPAYASDLKLGEDGVSHSEIFGTPARMKSLTAVPLKLASEREKTAYQGYLSNYNRFWRRFYDPIAIRYEKDKKGNHEMETFILPLIDNSIYNSLRGFLPGEGAQNPLRIPVIEPQPIAMMSFNMNEEAWLNLVDESASAVEGTLGLGGDILDLLGPDVHLALHDADPIIAIGNGELAGLFGQMDGREMVWISAFVSVLTRPCSVSIGLQNPGEVRERLTEMAWSNEGLEESFTGFGEGSLTKITGQERWIYRWTIEDAVTLRFGIEVQDRYLVINNMPFSQENRITGSKLAPNGAAHLELTPAACKLQLPALFASAVENSRSNASAGAACLTPLMMLEPREISAAQARHRELFGFEPLHPGGGSWRWDAQHGELVSSLYGPQWAQRQPPFDPNNEAVGLMRAVSKLALSMQFEDDGLRSSVHWQTRE